jgi:hypothetical protein
MKTAIYCNGEGMSHREVFVMGKGIKIYFTKQKQLCMKGVLMKQCNITDREAHNPAA